MDVCLHNKWIQQFEHICKSQNLNMLAVYSSDQTKDGETLIVTYKDRPINRIRLEYVKGDSVANSYFAATVVAPEIGLIISNEMNIHLVVQAIKDSYQVG